MKISVVIPTFNRCESLRVTLHGLARQTYPSSAFEVVVVSDGSTDDTSQMAAAFQSDAPFPFRYEQQENGGPSRARNRGIQLAQNEVIVFLDDDVEPIPEFLERHARHHAIENNIVILGPMSPDPLRSETEPVWISWEHTMLQKIYRMFGPGGALYGSLAGPNHFYSGNVSLRREWLVAVHGFDPSFTRQEDVELAVRMVRRCGVVFRFDFTADGIHRPTRTLDSWLKIPDAYGRLDAERLASGGLDPNTVSDTMSRRHIISRLTTSAALMNPLFDIVIQRLLLGAAIGAARLKRNEIAQAALSALYNVRYAQAYRSTRSKSRSSSEKAV